MPLFGPPNIDKLKSRLDIKGLIKALDYEKDTGIRDQAIEALGELGGRTATEPLLFLLEKEHCGCEPLVISALGKIKDERAVPVLIDRVRGQGATSSPAELSALEHIGPPAVEPLLEVMRENAQDVKQSLRLIEVLERSGGERAAAGLRNLISPRYPSLISHLADVLERLGDKDAVPHLVSALKAAPAETWCAPVVKVLQRMGWQPDDHSEEAAVLLSHRNWDHLAGMGEAAVDILIPLLHKGPAEEKLKAAETLGRIKDDRAVEPLAALLGSRRHEIAAAAARALGDIGSALAVEPLLQNGVESESASVRAETEKALISIGDTAVGPLLEQLNSSNPGERKAAVRILGEIGDERALQPLVSARDDTSLQPELQEALEKLGWQPPESES
jgi:HEAT repeat protein